MSQTPSQNQLEPESFIKILPEILTTLRAMNAHKLHVVPIDGGGFEVEIVEVNRLYVSRRELAEMLPKFTPSSTRTDYVDRLVELGIPHVNATGSRLYNVPKVTAWLEKWFGCGGGTPNHKDFKTVRS